MPDSHNVRMVKVLCYYKAWGRHRGFSRSWYDSIMIYVARSSEIEEAFQWEMSKYIGKTLPNMVHPSPLSIRLISYRTENGVRKFDETYQLHKQENSPCRKSGASSR